MSKRTKIIILSLVVALGAMFFVPFTTVVVPEWRIIVSDREGSVCVQKRVTQYWSHDSLGIPEYGGVDNRLTDSNGIVMFPERNVTASLVYRIVITAIRAVGALFHAGGWGISGSVYATGFVSPDGSWALHYDKYKPLPQKLVVDECSYESEPEGVGQNN